MRIRRMSGSLLLVLTVAACERSPETITGNAPRPSMATATAATSLQGTIGINVLLKGPATAAQLAELNTLGTVTDEIPELNALLIATQFAIAFQGGGGAMNKGAVPSQPNVWEHDQNSHGTHVTSTILGYRFGATPINGIAPKATIIPVKVLKQSGFGWSSMIARGIVYITDLKMAGQLGASPAVINMSLGGPSLDVVEQAAIDPAVAHGVIIVAAAGNAGTKGMGFPGAYEPVISVAAVGWTGQWVAHPFGSGTFCNSPRNWWVCGDVADPTDPNDFFIAPFSSRPKAW